jgi:hypothetical protein
MFARSLIALAALSLSAPLASASITSVTGNTTWLGSPPAACGFNQLAGQVAYAWDEKQGVNLFLNVDMINNPGTSTSPIPGTVGGGPMDSHFIHFQGVPGVIGVTGTVSFSAPIAAVIFTNTNLDASDAPAGAPATIYPTLYPFRGLSTLPPSIFSISGNTLSFNFQTIVPSNFIDQVRVITHSMPAPGSAAMLGLAGASCARRRRR